MLSKYYLILIIILLFSSCATNKAIKTSQDDPPHLMKGVFLPGVDSAVVKNAVQISNRLLVDFNRHNEASLWYQKSLTSYQIADSFWNTNLEKQIVDSTLIKLVLSWKREHNTTQLPIHIAGNLEPDDIIEICRLFLNYADKEASQAKLLDPFNLDVRSLLVKIYIKHGEISNEPVYYDKAIQELKSFLLVDKSNPFIYEKLAECYYALKDWESCFKNFYEAEQTLKIVSEFNSKNDHDKNIPIDTVRWVYYLHRQGEARAKLYDANNAIYYLTKAKELSSSSQTKQQLQNFLDWINWDNGNIRASEIKDNTQKMESLNDYKNARSEYLELLKILRTQKAQNEINWKIATIDYNFLSRKKEALKRLFHVIQNIKASNRNNPLSDIYLKDYAAMCYSIGVDYFKEHKDRLAYIYFNQASQFDWEHKGNAFFQLAVLSQQNPSETIHHGEKALEYQDLLPPNVIKKIYELLAVSYQRKGEFEAAEKYFNNLQKLN